MGLDIELDGGHHSEQGEYDDKRTSWMEGRRYRVLKNWNNDVMQDIEGVKSVILRKLETIE